MESIDTQNLLRYFAVRGNRFKNAVGMEIGLIKGNSIWTGFNLCNYKHGPFTIDITTDSDRPPEFIEGFKLQSLEDIDIIGYNNSWMRYLNGEAVISVSPLELEATLDFKIMKSKTIVFSLDLHFYDEVYEHLSLPGDFHKYIASREKQLEIAAQNRYRF